MKNKREIIETLLEVNKDRLERASRQIWSNDPAMAEDLYSDMRLKVLSKVEQYNPSTPLDEASDEEMNTEFVCYAIRIMSNRKKDIVKSHHYQKQSSVEDLNYNNGEEGERISAYDLVGKEDQHFSDIFAFDTALRLLGCFTDSEDKEIATQLMRNFKHKDVSLMTQNSIARVRNVDRRLKKRYINTIQQHT